MFVYFINNIILFFLLFFARKKNFFILLLGILSVAVIIYLLPGEAPDYYGYQRDYLSGKMIDAYPFFTTVGAIDSEPYYRMYSAFMRVVTGFSFHGYLALNFMIWYLVLYKGLKSIFKPQAVTIFLMMGFFAIVPALFYYLLRGGVPYVLVALAFVFYVKKRPYWAMAVSFIAMGFHSQYIPAIFVLGLSYFWYEYFIKDNQTVEKIVIYAGVVSLLLLIIFKFAVPILSMLTFLPTDTSFLAGKARALSSGTQGFRLTAFLSLLVFPWLYYYLVRNKKFLKIFKIGESKETYKRFIFLLGSVVLLSFVLNLVFISTPLVSSRLSKFSDYFFMMVGVGTFFLTLKNADKLLPIILLVIAVLVPFLYPAVYQFNISIIDIW